MLWYMLEKAELAVKRLLKEIVVKAHKEKWKNLQFLKEYISSVQQHAGRNKNDTGYIEDSDGNEESAVEQLERNSALLPSNKELC